MPKILDVIVRPKIYASGYNYYIVLDEVPKFLYERSGYMLLAEDDGFYDALVLQHDLYEKAFAGREFDIKLKDGTVVKANGQWWSTSHPERDNLTDIGYSTLEKLEECYVFYSGSILTSKLVGWLEKNEPSEDYNKYDKRKKPDWQKG